MARGDVVDVDEVQPGIDEGRHASGRGLDDDAAGRRRPHVARADRRRRVDDDGRQPVPADHGLDQAFRRDLAALVGADRLFFGQRTILGRVRSIDELQGRDAAGVDDALDAGAQRLLHDEPGSLDIVAVDFFRVSRPETIVGGRVKEESDALQRRRKRGGIAEVALAHGVARIEIRARARRAHQGLDVVPAGAQLTRDRRSEKAAGAGDKHAAKEATTSACPRRATPRSEAAFAARGRIISRSFTGIHQRDANQSLPASSHGTGRRKSIEVEGLYRKKTRNDRAVSGQKAKGRQTSQGGRWAAKTSVSALRDLPVSLLTVLGGGLGSLLTAWVPRRRARAFSLRIDS